MVNDNEIHGKASLWASLTQTVAFEKAHFKSRKCPKSPFLIENRPKPTKMTVLELQDPIWGPGPGSGPGPEASRTRPGPQNGVPGPQNGVPDPAPGPAREASGAPQNPGCPYRPLISYKIGGIPTKTLEG